MNFIRKYKYIINLVIVLALFFYSSIFQLIPIKLFNIDIDNISIKTDALLTLFSNVLLALLLFLIYFKDLKRYFIDFKNNLMKYMDDGFKIWFIGLMIMGISNLVINTFMTEKIANNESAVRSLIEASPIATFIITAFLAPFIEEIIFRKAFKDIFKEKWLFILTSGIVFGSLHVVGSITTLYDFLYLVPYCSLGIAFAYMYHKTNNLMVNITMHTIHNAALTLITILVSVLGILI